MKLRPFARKFRSKEFLPPQQELVTAGEEFLFPRQPEESVNEVDRALAGSNLERLGRQFGRVPELPLSPDVPLAQRFLA